MQALQRFSNDCNETKKGNRVRRMDGHGTIPIDAFQQYFPIALSVLQYFT